MKHRTGDALTDPGNLGAVYAAADTLIGCGIVFYQFGQSEEWDRVIREMNPEWFPSPRHRDVWAAMATLRERGEPLCPFAIAHEAEKLGPLVDLIWLGECAAQVMSPSALWPVCVRVLREAATQNEAQRLVAELIGHLRSERDPVARGEEMAALGQKLIDMNERRGRGMRDHARGAFERASAAARGDRTGLELIGWPNLAGHIGRMEPGEMTLIGGRTSGGKSTLLKCLAVALGFGGTPVGILSLEDREAIWTDRILADLANVPVLSIRGGALDRKGNAGEWARMHDATVRAGNLPLHLLYLGTATTAEVVGGICELVRRGAAVVMVDYVQCIRDPNPDRVNALGASVGRIKTACARLGVPLLLTTQWPNEYNRSEHPPSLGAAKGSGDIENAAENIVWVWTPGKPAEVEHNETSLLVVKAKNGECGNVAVTFEREFTRIYEGSPRPWMPPGSERDRGGDDEW